jgi:hypothetical protein
VNTWTVACDLGGGARLRLRYAVNETTARQVHADIVEHIDPAAELVDLLTEAHNTYPAHGKVRHSTTGAVGAVEDVEVTYPGTVIVQVRWADGRLGWYHAGVLTPAET